MQSVVNALGQEVYSRNVVLEAGDNTIEINAAGFPIGIFNAVIESNGGKPLKNAL